MKPPLTTEARPEIDPRYRSLCESLFDLLTGLRHEEAARFVYQFVQAENQVLTEALEESERLRKLSVVLVADFHALRASEERLAIALSEAQRDLELGSPINAATTIRRALQRPTP